jgi:hypothetical protein
VHGNRKEFANHLYQPIYEDFDSTVERIRLLLINKEILTRAEIKDFGWVRSKWPWCVGIFVRHAINHGPYPLASLGKEPNRNHVRNKAKKPEDEDIYIYCGRLAVKYVTQMPMSKN